MKSFVLLVLSSLIIMSSTPDASACGRARAAARAVGARAVNVAKALLPPWRK